MGWLYTLLVLGMFIITGCGDHKEDSAWTVMLYMAGDNDLSSVTSKDLAEMEAVGSTPAINVVVQVDTMGGTTRRLFVNSRRSTLIEDLGEKNMADRQTLLEFILWAKARYPARRYALILWSHGNGFAKALPPSYKIIQDDTDGVPCCLSNAAVHKAIEEAGVHFDLLGFDASQMGQVETAYEFRKVADILVFSQETGQSSGWDYTAILNTLTGDPFMGRETLAQAITGSYKKFYENSNYPGYLTISAVRLKEIETLAIGIDTLAKDLSNALKDETLSSGIVRAVGTARDQVQELTPFTTPFTYIDIFDFLEKLKESSLPEGILHDIQYLLAIRGRVVLSEWHGPATPHASGLSIVFFKLPEALEFNYDDYSKYLGSEKEIDFLADNEWDDFLLNYYQKSGLLHRIPFLSE